MIHLSTNRLPQWNPGGGEEDRTENGRGSREIKSSGDYVMYILEKAHVACVDGAAFCAPGYMRLSYATSDDNIREAMRRIREAMRRIREASVLLK